MRSIPFIVAAFVASGPATAQSWEEYSYPRYAFAVTFPAKPQVEQTTSQVVDDRLVPAQVYSVRQGDLMFKMTVAELAGTNLEESAIIGHAIKTLSQGATVRLNIPARIYQVYGRQLTVEGADSSRSMVQLFDYKDRFYQIEAKALPGQRQRSPCRRGPFSSIAHLHRRRFKPL
jgi:hypothetical protein